nr:retrovirus-related Pol polyprotein from transposon TNT 1-94 [Tanacetum cinerariifolium]
MEIPGSKIVSSLSAERKERNILEHIRHRRKIRMTNMKGKSSSFSWFVKTSISSLGSRHSSSSIVFITAEISSSKSNLASGGSGGGRGNDGLLKSDSSLSDKSFLELEMELSTCNSSTTSISPFESSSKSEFEKVVKTEESSLTGSLDSISLSEDSGFELNGFSDADYARCKDTFKSTSGGAQFLGEKLVSWSSKKQDSIAISYNSVRHSRTKHIAVRYHFIKEHVENGRIELYFVKTDYQLADLFTKALPADCFNYLVRRLGMRSLSPQELDRLAKSHQSRRDLPRNTTLDRVEVLDADYAGCKDTFKSTFGGAQFLGEKLSDRLRDKAQRENDEFLKSVDENMKKIIKEQVKDQVKIQVSKILPRIEQAINEQLEAEVLIRSSHSSKTSYVIAADISEMELEKILIEKMEGNTSIQRSDE